MPLIEKRRSVLREYNFQLNLLAANGPLKHGALAA